MKRAAIVLLVAAAIAAADTSLPARRHPLVVVTDASWSGAAKDDGEWSAAAEIEGPVSHGAHYGVDNLFARATKARWIWAGDGTTCVLRRTIDVSGTWRRAEMLVTADDVAEVSINGTVAATCDTLRGWWGMRGGGQLVDMAPFLVSGRNTVTVRAENRGGPHGFACEIRIDAPPFVFPRGSGRALTAEDARAIDAMIAPAARSPLSLLRLSDAVARHGVAAAPVLRAHKGDSEVVEALLSGLDPDMSQMTSFGADGVVPILRNGAGLPVALRHVLTIRALGDIDENVRAALESADDDVWERTVRTIAAADLRSLVLELARAVKERPKTRAGAFAAAALGRMGDASHVKRLIEAASCGYAPTERAARHALRLLR
jgi:hypothetical protein